MEEFKKSIETALEDPEKREWLVERLEKNDTNKRRKVIKYKAYGSWQDDDYKNVSHGSFTTPLRDTKEEVAQDLIKKHLDDFFELIDPKTGEFDNEFYQSAAKALGIPADFVVTNHCDECDCDEFTLNSKYGVFEHLRWVRGITSKGSYTDEKWDYEIEEIEL
jgi:hypothetical protein